MVTAIQVLPAPQLIAAQAPSLKERALDAINSSDADFFQSLDAGALKGLLDEIVLDLGPANMDRLAELLSLETLEAAVREQYPEHISSLETARAMLQEAKYYLETTECKASSSWKACLGSILDLLCSVLESFLRAFGIAEFFKPPENALDGEFKSQKIMMLLSLFTMMSGIMIPLLGAELAAMIIGGTLLGIAALSLIYPLIKPQASMLPRGTNWTAELKQGNLFVADGRKETLDKMAHALTEGTHHLMLLGKTGIGKTATAKAFTQAIERGDYPELQGKQVFYFNTADLVAGTEAFTSANKIFSQISEAMGRHRKNFILIFDELHMACKEQDQGTLSEQLKTYLDPGTNNFPCVIGITTEEEFYQEIYQHNAAFARRFQKVVIDNTEDEETVKILQGALLKQAPAVLLEDGALQTLLARTQAAFEDAAQPGTALKILSQCINKTAASQRSPKEAEVERVRGQLQAHYAQGAGRLPYGRENGVRELETQLQELEVELKKTKEEIDALFQDRNGLLELKKATMRKIVDVGDDKQQLNLLSLQIHFEARMREAKIREEAEALGITTVIDWDLIGEAIDEELANNQRVLDAVHQGREQLNERAEA